jgi:pimeloyl-ACP methyl ester carboxylesterase
VTGCIALAAGTIPQPTVVRVADGTDVGVYEYGDPDGHPVLTFHGVPACGAGFAWADEPARARGLRIIAPDRPGVGLSTPIDKWGVADYPAMIARLASALGLSRWSVWGYSGGGPYAVAVAAGLPQQVDALAVAAGMGEVGTWANADDFAKTDRQMLSLAVKHPAVARVMMSATGRLARLSPKSAVRSFEKELSETDRALLPSLGDPAEAIALFTQAFLRGGRGVVDDYRAIAGAWGVDFATITAPTRVFQGTADTMVPAQHADGLVERIPGAELVSWPGEGHLGTIAHVEEILDWIVQVSSRG